MLHALGTQPVPVEGLRGVHQPPSGNMLAMKDWRPPRPPPFKELLRQRRYLIQSSGTIPSLRHTTIEVLGSLPEPKETAQTLVIRSGDEDVGRRKSYRRSISDLWKRLSSRSRPHGELGAWHDGGGVSWGVSGWGRGGMNSLDHAAIIIIFNESQICISSNELININSI